MGQEQTSSGAISSTSIYITTQNEYYYPGEYIKGEISLLPKIEQFYEALILTLNCQEYVARHSEENGAIMFSKKQQTYSSGFSVHQFSQGLTPGRYVYPFEILLPDMITGSFVNFYRNRYCHIKYTLKAELIHAVKQNCKSTEIYVNIIEQPRVKTTNEQITTPITSSSCNTYPCSPYCCPSNKLRLTLSTTTNNLQNNQPLNFQCIIDNTEGIVPVRSVCVSLEEMIGIGMRVDGVREEDVGVGVYGLFEGEVMVGVGDRSCFGMEVLVPDVKCCTAIGRFVARYYVLILAVDYGCCNQPAKCAIHIIITSTHPQILKNKPLPQLPQSLNTKTHPVSKFHNMKPYIYTPHPNLQFLNLPKNSSAIMMQENNGLQLYPKPERLYYMGMNTGMVDNYPMLSMEAINNRGSCRTISQNQEGENEEEEDRRGEQEKDGKLSQNRKSGKNNHGDNQNQGQESFKRESFQRESLENSKYYFQCEPN